MASPTVLEGMEAEGVKAAAFLDPLQSHYERDPSVLEQREDVTFQDIECSVVGIVSTEIDFYLDKASDLLVGVKLAYFDPMTGPVKAVMQFSDYVDHGGVMFPETRTLVLQDGAMTIDYTYTKTELDVELDETLFEKP